MRRNKVIELISQYQVDDREWQFYNQRNTQIGSNFVEFPYRINKKTKHAYLLKSIDTLERFLKANYPLVGEAKVEQDLPEVQPDRFKLNFKPEVKNGS